MRKKKSLFFSCISETEYLQRMSNIQLFFQTAKEKINFLKFTNSQIHKFTNLLCKVCIHYYIHTRVYIIIMNFNYIPMKKDNL